MRNSGSQTKKSGKGSVLVAGLGAVLVASLLTLKMLPSNPPPAPEPAQQPAVEKTCEKVPLLWYVSSPDGGTVRFREGDYLSPPYRLSAEPQPVVFPKLRAEQTILKEEIIIEGNASNVTVMNVTGFSKSYQVNGREIVDASWASNCEIAATLKR